MASSDMGDYVNQWGAFCASLLTQGMSAADAQKELTQQGVDPQLAAQVVEQAARSIKGEQQSLANVLPVQAADQQGQPADLEGLVEHGRRLLEGGQTLVDVYQHFVARCSQAASDQSQALATARLLVESVGAVFDRNAAAPLDHDAFLAQFREDHAMLLKGPEVGPSGALYPEFLSERFFANPQSLLDLCSQLGAKSLERLWTTAVGGDEPLPTGTSHIGRLKDKRRYLILRMPPPQFRFEAHFVALVGDAPGVPARMFAIERGMTEEEAVFVESYVDGRLRLGPAGPAESKNFIRLVRQQLGLA